MKGHKNMDQYSIELNNVKKCYKVNEGNFFKKNIKEITAISDIKLSIERNETIVFSILYFIGAYVIWNDYLKKYTSSGS
ncbi:hypothetical protein CBF30_10545 [Vagococcus entomophilus]|uniref:Uncharacterized protein n=1 Tax=Vagococcus entomophilus TaxID=1160095 RepID=A0A430AF00_9ENTE|nr:hypothetical protein CBF30_10545 [Vagococcus entomophilus]